MDEPMWQFIVLLLLWAASGLVLLFPVMLWANYRNVYLDMLMMRDEAVALGPLILWRIWMIEHFRRNRWRK